MPETPENPIPLHLVEPKIRALHEDTEYETVTICGSMEMYPEMLLAAQELTLQGAIVLLPFVVKDSDMSTGQRARQHEVERALPDGIDLHIFLDAMHREKIDRADRVVVVTNYQNYIGDSTRAEVTYAIEAGKDITFMKYPKSIDRKENP